MVIVPFSYEVPFRPARVILQDFTGVPAVVDFAAMRDAVQKLGGDPEKINPQCPSDLVIDHSVQVKGRISAKFRISLFVHTSQSRVRRSTSFARPRRCRRMRPSSSSATESASSS